MEYAGGQWAETGRAFQLDPVSAHFDALVKFVGTNVLGDEGLSYQLKFWTEGGIENAHNHAIAIPGRSASAQLESAGVQNY